MHSPILHTSSVPASTSACSASSASVFEQLLMNQTLAFARVVAEVIRLRDAYAMRPPAKCPQVLPSCRQQRK